MNITRLFILRPVATLLLSLALLLLGCLGYRLLPVAPLPQIDFPTIVVSANLSGASPETMAATVATPLERAMGSISGISEMSSINSQGSTVLILQFELNRDINGAARDVQAAINASRSLLPSAMPSLPTYHKANPSEAPIIMLALTSKSRSPGQLYDIAESKIQQSLAQVSGVGEVSLLGSALPAVRIDLQPLKLVHYGISLETVRKAIVNSTSNLPKGTLQGSETSWSIDSNSQLQRAADYRPLLIRYQNGHAVRLADVANVYDSIQDKYVSGALNGQPAVLIGITRQANANMLQTIDMIKAKLPALHQAIPADTELNLVLDRSPNVRASLYATEETLLTAVLLVIVVVFIFLRDWRSVLIPALAMPISLIGTSIFMYLLGYSLDNLSLMALIIATGFVVDDAIVVLENIMRHIEEGLSPVRAAIRGAREVSFTVLSMTVSLIAVFIPILLMGSLVGRLFREFAVTLSISLLLSMLVSLTLTPMLCSRLLKPLPKVPRPKVGIFGWIERQLHRLHQGYLAALAWVLAHQRLTLLSLLMTIVVNIGLYTVVQKGFFPNQDTGMLIGAAMADENTSYQAMTPKVKQFEQMIMADPAVDTVISSRGGGFFGSRNSARFFIRLKDQDQRKESAAAIANRLSRQGQQVAGAEMFFMAAQDLRVGGRSAHATYQYSLQADDLATLRQWTPKVEQALREIPQLTSVSSDASPGGQQVELTIDRDRATRLGLDIDTIDSLLNNSFSQRQIATQYKILNQYKVVMMLQPSDTQTPEQLKNTYIINSSGDRIPLSAVATFKGGNAPLSVSHEGQSATSTISFNTADGVSLEEAQRLVKQAMAQIGLPSDVAANFAGTAAAFGDLVNTMPWLILAALATVYIVLGILYESYIHPLTILSTLPSAGVGALLLLILTDTQLTLIALIGIILLIGIVQKNAIMLIDFANDAERNQKMSPQQAITAACSKRFRPIMMTTLAAFFGALPLALGSGGDADLRSPLGLTIAGGLVVSQLLTLFTTPVVYLWLDRFSRLVRRYWQRYQVSGNSL